MAYSWWNGGNVEAPIILRGRSLLGGHCGCPMAFKRKYRNKFRKFKKSRRGRSSRRGPRTFKARVAQVLNQKVETKYFDQGVENVNLYHNIGYSPTLPTIGTQPGSLSDLFNPWQDIGQGVGRQSRIGDKIHPRGFSLKIWLANKDTRPNVMYRIMVVRCPKTVSNTIVTYNNINPFQPVNQGNVGNSMILPLDKDQGYRALYDRVFNLQLGSSNSGATLREPHKLVKLWIKRKNTKPIIYDQSVGGPIVNNPLLIYVIPYDSWGTPTSDNIASCAYHCRLYFKDY